jgi:hypothetical protein
MSYNGSGTFNINTTGQPVVAGTVISSSAFNALTTDLATGLTTAITKDGQTTTTARITFAQGITSSLVTDSSSVSTGSIITAGGAGIAKNLYVGVNANVAGTLGVTGVATFSAAPIYSSLTASSAVATDASKGLVSVTNTGTGNNVLATSPTLVTPALGTPASGVLTNTTGLPLSTGVTGTLPEANGGTGTTTGYYGFKNRLINGAMLIAQRGTTPTSTNLWYPADRFRLAVSNSSKVNLSQSTTAPTGFVNSILATSLATTTVGAGEAYEVSQQIEGYNIADLGWGTASAKTVTLSFWVRSSLTGTFGGTFENSGNTRAYPFSYTISVANTWEQKTITVAGDTSGTWLTDNSRGIIIRWSLGTGSTYLNTANAWVAGEYYSVTGETKLVATNGATWYITGTQLEVGSTATSFDYRPYGTELQLCQRYFWRMSGVSGGNNTFASAMVYASTDVRAVLTNPVLMRTSVSVSITGTNYGYSNAGSVKTLATINAADLTPQTFLLYSGAGTTSATVGQAAQYVITNVDSYISVSAEL